MSGISVASVGAQQLVASQTSPPSSQTATAEGTSNESSNTVAEPAQSGSANNNAGQSGTNAGSGDANANAAASGTAATSQTSTDRDRGGDTALAGRSGQESATQASKADLALSEATPKSQVEAKVYEDALDESIARDQALAQQERARMAALVEQLAAGPASNANLLDPQAEAPSGPPVEVAVPDAIPDRLPPRAGVTT